jgi:hypothetical protein
MIRGITVIGDLLRPDGSGNPGGVDAPVIWLFNAIKRQVALASGLSISVLSTRHLPELAHALRHDRPTEDSALFWARRHEQLDLAGCAAAMPDRDGNRFVEAFARDVVPRLREHFCIGYELPPYLVAILDQEGIPYLDLRIHPVRFLDDLLFAVRSTDMRTQAALLDMAVPEAEVVATAGLREAMCQMITNARLPGDTLVVLGQRPMDSTQIIGGRFFDAMDHVDRIRPICDSHKAVLLKPHPQEREHSLLAVTSGIASNIIGVTDDNLYRLLSLPQVTAVLTVNSSAAHEIPYFGQHLYTLGPLPIRLAWRGDDPDAGRHVSIGDQVLTPDFWRVVLAPHAPVSRLDGMRLAPKPNRLRIALDSFWNFQEIDTDRVPARPR